MRDQPEFPGLSSTALRVLREDQPDPDELDAAYRRFARKPAQHAPALLVSRWLIAGLVMGLGIAFGADAVVQHLQPPLPAQLAASIGAARAARKAAPREAPLPSHQDTPDASAEPPAIIPEAPPRAASSASAKAAAVSMGDPPAADSAFWAKAAHGLRSDDFAETEAALATLEHAGSASDREAARLIRAQLMLHQGDASGARALLQDLADNAQSAQVRAQARRLLAQSSAKSNSALNAAPSGT